MQSIEIMPGQSQFSISNSASCGEFFSNMPGRDCPFFVFPQYAVQFSSVAQSCPTLQPYGLQHARLPCSSPTPRACSNSCPSSQWRHPTISFSVVPFSSYPQSFSASGSFWISQFFISSGQSIGVSASVLPVTVQDWSPLGGAPSSSHLSTLIRWTPAASPLPTHPPSQYDTLKGSFRQSVTPDMALAPAEGAASLGVVRNAEFCVCPRPAQGDPAF